MKRILFILFSLPFLLFSQTEYPTYKIMLNDSLGDFNFYDLKSQYDNYFATSDRGRGSGFKQIMRFENFVERRVAPSEI